MTMNIDKSINLFLGIAILFALVAALFPVAQVQGDTLANSGFPLGSLFGVGGVIFIVIAAFLVKQIVKDSRGGR